MKRGCISQGFRVQPLYRVIYLYLLMLLLWVWLFTVAYMLNLYIVLYIWSICRIHYFMYLWFVVYTSQLLLTFTSHECHDINPTWDLCMHIIHNVFFYCTSFLLNFNNFVVGVRRNFVIYTLKQLKIVKVHNVIGRL